MRPAAARAERAFEIRRAARAWQRTGIIDDPTLASIESSWPDDRVRARPMFRVLFFFFTAFAIYSSFGLILVSGFDGKDAIGALFVLYGGALAALTEIQTGRLRRNRGGTEEATALSAVLFLALGFGWISFEGLPLGNTEALTLTLLGCGALCAAAAWRWGMAALGAGGALFLFWSLSRLPHGRALWVVAAGLLVLPLLEGQAHRRLAPSQRRACGAALVFALGAGYAAISIHSLDRGLVEIIGGRSPGFWRLMDGAVWNPMNADWAVHAPLPWSWLRIACAILTAALPAVLIVAGLMARRRHLLDAGAVLLAVSIATVRAYVHLAPAWVVLSAGGLGAIALALATRRWLEGGPGRERAGFTAEPVFERPGRGSGFAVVATLAALSPAARALPREEAGFRGKGGSAGGAGAGGEF